MALVLVLGLVLVLVLVLVLALVLATATLQRAWRVAPLPALPWLLQLPLRLPRRRLPRRRLPRPRLSRRHRRRRPHRTQCSILPHALTCFYFVLLQKSGRE